MKRFKILLGLALYNAIDADLSRKDVRWCIQRGYALEHITLGCWAIALNKELLIQHNLER